MLLYVIGMTVGVIVGILVGGLVGYAPRYDSEIEDAWRRRGTHHVDGD